MTKDKKETTSIGLMDSTVKSAIELTGVENGFSVFADRKRQRASLALLNGGDEEKVSVFYPPLSEEITSWVEDCPEHQVITADDNVIYWMLKQKVGFDFDSVLCAPFRVRGKAIGLTGLIIKGEGEGQDQNKEAGHAVLTLSLLNERAAARLENRLLLKSFECVTNHRNIKCQETS